MRRERAVATIDLGAVTANVAALRSGLAGAARLCAVVKADGYGHGAVAVAQAARHGRVTWLAVATVDEAAELRAAGIRSRLLVLGPLTGREVPMLRHLDLDLLAWSPAFVRACASAHPQVRLHVKVDTGMHRAGVDVAGLAAVTETFVTLGLAPVGIASHLATADGDVDAVQRQLTTFEEATRRLRRTFPRLERHIANSAATLRFPQSHLEMVRCGLALYGLDPFGSDGRGLGLHPVLTVSSYVAHVRRVPPGDGVGYGLRDVAREPRDVALVPFGYADGLSRALAGQAHMLVRGHRCPLVGVPSMDSCTIDVTGVPGARAGDAVIVIGTQGGQRVTVEDHARWTATIPYEVVTRLGRRVRRVTMAAAATVS